MHMNILFKFYGHMFICLKVINVQQKKKKKEEESRQKEITCVFPHVNRISKNFSPPICKFL